MRHGRVVERPHDVGQGIRVAHEGDEAFDVLHPGLADNQRIDKLDRGRGGFFRMVHIGENLQASVRDGDNPHIRFAAGPRAGAVRLRHGLKDGRFAGGRQSDNTDVHTDNLLCVMRKPLDPDRTI